MDHSECKAFSPSFGKVRGSSGEKESGKGDSEGSKKPMSE